MNISVVSHALIKSEEGLSLHPTLSSWKRQFNKRNMKWFECDESVPLSWLAAIADVAPASLLASRLEKQRADIQQYWVASPYYAQLGRDYFQVMPDALFPWSTEDAEWLCGLLNPLLKHDGMMLEAVGAALVLLCQYPFDVKPVPFAQVSGSLLPDQHPKGHDGGRLMRLLSEIQMLLNQHPAEHRRRRGEPDIHGLWLWGGGAAASTARLPTIATRDPFVHAIVDGKNAEMMMTDAEQLSELLKDDATLPKAVILAGAGYAVWLSRSIMPRLRKGNFKPAKVCKSEADLIADLRREINL